MRYSLLFTLLALSFACPAQEVRQKGEVHHQSGTPIVNTAISASYSTPGATDRSGKFELSFDNSKVGEKVSNLQVGDGFYEILSYNGKPCNSREIDWNINGYNSLNLVVLSRREINSKSVRIGEGLLENALQQREEAIKDLQTQLSQNLITQEELREQCKFVEAKYDQILSSYNEQADALARMDHSVYDGRMSEILAFVETGNIHSALDKAMLLSPQLRKDYETIKSKLHAESLKALNKILLSGNTANIDEAKENYLLLIRENDADFEINYEAGCFFSSIGEYQMAIGLLNNAGENTGKRTRRVDVYLRLFDTYYAMGDLQNAEKNLKRCISYVERVSGGETDNFRLAQLYNLMAGYYIGTLNYSSCETSLNKASTALNKIATDTPDKLEEEIMVAINYAALCTEKFRIKLLSKGKGDKSLIEKAEQYLSKTRQLQQQLEQKHDIVSKSKPNYLRNLTAFFNLTGQSHEALKCGQELLQIYKNKLNTNASVYNKIEYARCLHQQGLYYAITGREKSDTYFIEALNLLEEINMPSVVNNTLADLFFNWGICYADDIKMSYNELMLNNNKTLSLIFQSGMKSKLSEFSAERKNHIEDIYAMKYLCRAIGIYSELEVYSKNYYISRVGCFSALGELFNLRGSYSQALTAFKLALEMYEQYGDQISKEIDGKVKTKIAENINIIQKKQASAHSDSRWPAGYHYVAAQNDNTATAWFVSEYKGDCGANTIFNGNGALYDENQYCLYNGEWRNDRPAGKGEFYFYYLDSTKYFSGELRNQLPYLGKLYQSGYKAVEGKFKLIEQGSESGTTLYYRAFSDGCRYEGSSAWDDCYQKTIKGTYFFVDGSRYEGDIFKGHFNGQGTLYKINNDCYTGGFVNSRFDGKGEYRYKNGTKKAGIWSKGKLEKEKE